MDTAWGLAGNHPHRLDLRGYWGQRDGRVLADGNSGVYLRAGYAF